MKWFERTFALGLAPEALPAILERLRTAPERLERVLRSHSAEALRRRPGGGWSVLEHAGHLGDLETLWYGRLEDLLGRADRLRAADLENRATWDADHNDRTTEAVAADFRVRRNRFVERLATLGEDDLRATAPHPRLEQPMSIVDLCFFVAEHDDHHLAAMDPSPEMASDS